MGATRNINMFLGIFKRINRVHLLLTLVLLFVSVFLPLPTEAAASWWDNITNPFDAIVSGILSLFVSLAGGLLAIAGTGFDAVLTHTITDFAATFSKVESGVNATWAAFRDIANIIMISMFVFVAFAVILRSTNYGLKQFGVRILVVAVLINFSLFFTKAIVDVSNITASQFRSAIVVTAQGSDAGISTAFAETTGLSGGFLNGSFDILQKIAVTDNDLGGAFVYTVVVVVFFTALTAVLLYGLVLMVTRMVTLIILMVTSSLAFAAYMTPGMQSQWETWWKALVKNALFAPLFMMMLWATLNIAKTMSVSTEGEGGASASFADLAKSDGWGLVFNMIMIVGLLYASTKIADELSIKGAGAAKKLGSIPLRGLASGTLGVAGRLGRGTLGRAGTSLAENPALRRMTNSNNMLAKGIGRAGLGAAKKVGGASYDLRDNASLTKSLKAAGVNIGGGVGNYEKGIKDEAKYVADAEKAEGEIDEDITRGTAGAPIGGDQTTATAKKNAETAEKNAETAEKNAAAAKNNSTDQTNATVRPANDNAPVVNTDSSTEAQQKAGAKQNKSSDQTCLLYTSPSPRD